MVEKATRRGVLKLAGSAAVVAGVTGATKAETQRTQQHTSGDISRGGELNLTSRPITSLDPIQSTTTTAGSKIVQVYEGLTNAPAGEPRLENQLITDYQLSDDLVTYTFSLKQGVTFHDGTELQAADVKYSWRRLAESANSQRQGLILNELGIDHEKDDNGNVVPGSLAVDIVDTYTFEVTLQEPTAGALSILATDNFAVMPEGLVDDIEGYDGQYTQQEIATEVMVGTGPFTLETWAQDEQITMTAHDEYHDTGPYLESLQWAIISDSDARWDYAMNKNADIFAIPTDKYDPTLITAEEDSRGRAVGTYGPVENDETLRYLGVDTLATFYFGFDAKDIPRAVREAIAYVTNHQGFIDEIFKSRGTPAFSLTPPAIWPEGSDGYDQWVGEWPYGVNETDSESAETVLEEAGYTSDNPFEMTLTTFESQSYQDLGERTRDKLDGLGVQMEVETEPFNTLIERGENGDLEAYSLGWAWSWDDPAFGLGNIVPKSTNTDRIPEDASGFYLNWQAEDSDNVQKAADAWDRIQSNQGPDEEDIRQEAYVDMEEAQRDDQILLPLHHQLSEVVRYQWVEGPRFGALGSHRRQYNEFWVNLATAVLSDAVVPEDRDTVSTVTVDNVYLPNGGFIGIYDSGVRQGEPFESLRGSSDFLPQGQHDGVTVSLDDPFTDGQGMYAVVHKDTDGDESFDYVSSEGSDDGAYTNEDDEVVITPADVRFENSVAAYANNDDIVTTDGLRDGIDDWRGGDIDTGLLRDVIDAWRSGEPVE